jgi:uncharacterized protein
MMRLEKHEYIIFTSLIIAVALVVCATILAGSFIYVQNKDQTIVVTGSARKRIRSDLVVWRTGLSVQADQLSTTYQGLTQNIATVKAYLISKGIAEDQIITSSITTKTVHTKAKAQDSEGNESGPITGYILGQSLEIRSKDVDKVTTISREVTELINQGIVLDSSAPEYHYTKIGELKIEMLAEASKDARARAQQIAASTGNTAGAVRAARMGVIQITAPDSNEVSGYGINDTSSLEKDITVVVNVNFGIN